MRELPTIERIRAFFDYDPLTGIVTWKRSRGRAKKGKRASNVSGRDRLRIGFDCMVFEEPRLIWALHTGEWPPDDSDVDHEDRDTLNNRFGNLRLATRAQNNANSKVREDNTSGYKGVSRFKNGWRAYINVDGKQVHLGIFREREDAARRQEQASLATFGEFARAA